MLPDEWERIKAVFETAAALERARREACIVEECAGDEEIAGEVRSLLAAHEAAGEFIEAPAAEAVEIAGRFEAAPPYERLGPYRLLERIGAGGMGSVYLAERDDEEFRKRVAIKVVGRGMSTDFILRRFRRERQILAGLSHPNITMLLDGGATPDGLPYFVMELVEGQPILAYCEEHKLPLAERLELFRTVCGAVQYAHRSQVVHRDLKPSNILVTTDGIPKLLDFGIARVFEPGTDEDSGRRTLSTQSLMTPEYASPEQVRGEPATPASDIYSLGVLLYELLTRRLPYRVETGTPQAMAVAVCEQEPEKPSAAATLPEAHAGGPQGSEPAADKELGRSLRGDLDDITLMALRKEPGHRYGSVAELSDDIRRYLEGLPVRARQGAKAYRAGKFVHRHRAGVLAAALTIVLLLAVGAIWMRWPATGPKLLSTGDRPSLNAEANEYFEKAQLINLANVNPPRILELLEKALQKDPSFTAARARYGFFHLVMIDLGFSDDATYLEKAEEQLKRALKEDPSQASTYAALAAVSFYRRRPLEVARYAAEAERLAPGHAESKIWLINQFIMMGDSSAARKLALETLQRDPYLYPVHMLLADTLVEQGDVEGAVRESEKVLEQNPRMMNCLHLLAKIHLYSGRQDRARMTLNRALMEDRGNFHFRLAWALLLAKEGKAQDAHRELDESVRRWATLNRIATSWVAEIYGALGETELALEWLDKAVRNGDHRVAWFRRDPHLEGLRMDPRFDEILAAASSSSR